MELLELIQGLALTLSLTASLLASVYKLLSLADQSVKNLIDMVRDLTKGKS